MKERLETSTKLARPMFNRRTSLATTAAFLTKPTFSWAGFEFPRHFIGANTAISGYGLFEAIDLLRDLGFRTIEIQNLVGEPKPISGKFQEFEWSTPTLNSEIGSKML